MKKILSMFTVFILVLAGCGGGSSSDKAYIYPSVEVESMDLTEVTYSQTFQLLTDVFTGLKLIDADGKLIAGMATDVTSSEDGLKYTFKLRDDAKWFDNKGEEKANVTAHDFEFAWKTMTADSSYSYIFEPIKNAAKVSAGDLDKEELGVKAVDDTTLEVELEYVAPYFESLMAFGAFNPIPQAAYEEYGDDWGQTGETTWYNGAYYPEVFKKEQLISLVKSDLYYDAESVQVEKVEYRTMQDANLVYNSFEAGDISWSTFPDLETYEAAKEAGTAHPKDTGYMYYLGMNQAEGPTTDINLRKALLYGVNREELTKGSAGRKQVEYFVPKGLTQAAYDGVEYRDYSSDSLVTYDLDKAKEYLQKYMDANGISSPADISLTYLSSDSEAGKAFAELLQASLKQSLGITIDVDIQPQTSYREKRSAADYDIILGGWGADYGDPLTYMGIAHSNNIGSYNPGSYNNPEIDEALDAVARETDTEKRFKELARIEEFLVSGDVVIIPVYQKEEPYLIDEQFTIGYHLYEKVSNRFTTVK